MQSRSKRLSSALEAWAGPITRSKRSTKNVKSDHPAAGNLSPEELTAVPAKSFPKFRELPLELRIIIFEFAISPDTFIEAIFLHGEHRFHVSSPNAPSIPPTHQKYSTSALLPIYLEPSTNLAMKRPLKLPPTKPIYIHIKDVLYIPEIHALDVTAFLRREENQAIENLAIQASSALRLGGDIDDSDSFSYSIRAFREGELVRGLKNLKKLYIVEGPDLGRERRLVRDPAYKWRFSWSRVKEGAEMGNTYAGIFKRNYKHEWNTGVADSIAQAIDTESNMMKQQGKSWNPPELIFRELKRTLVEA
ncbi:uncharacterized protein LY89DRAFT_726791 [Mollisia scopiformis]|uniref:Uncharacterized protein n=1 Tax=Mollisia scopiformis TaxID=149040 RepID=A0A194XU42_MOLSC|nr:uncharacterized protein LY89DRAFT_726791 [Mollisia scopiformis]KUJ23728.1 hypothetical protein LY89DRAFT_726791 [Mollisia scopiformis]